MTGTYTIPDDLLQYLRGRLGRGELGLFTGAGFSVGAKAIDGQPIPTVSELRTILWPIGFPGTPFDERSTLGDTFDCALQQSPNRLKDTLESCLRVDEASLHERYHEWFSIPWRRVYTLNVDDLDLAVLRRFTLPIRYQVVSHRSPIPSLASATWIVHLNGMLEDFPDITFSAPQYGARLPGRDPWYATLTADLLHNAFIFVGTSMDEPPLWQHLELRGTRGPGLVELRPRSFLVSPGLPEARRQLLSRFNVEHVPLTADEFAQQVFPEITDDTRRGVAAIQRRQQALRDPQPYRLVTDLRSEARPAAPAQYLLGRPPHWSDITDGYAVTRVFEERQEPTEVLLAPRFTLFTGTAGTGKTTTLMRACLELEAAGLSVGWVDTNADLPVHRFQKAVKGDGLDVLAIDDLDTFHGEAASLVSGLIRQNRKLQILASARTTGADRYGLFDLLGRVDGQNVVVPPLEDSDIDLLLDALSSAGVSGELRRMSRADQRRVLRDRCGRQLLVSMIEVTSGKPFRDKIDDECYQLEPDSRFIYSLAALATRSGTWLNRQELLVASEAPSLDTLNRLRSLIGQHLVVESKPDHLTARHRVIAEGAVDYFRRERHLAAAIRGLLFAMATQQATLSNRNSRQAKLLRRLINHKFMSVEIGDIMQARAIYEELRELLREDYHFWLQRGSLEVEVGDLSLAENYLGQAKSINDGDFRVQTAWAYMNLKRASRDAASGVAGWRERADEAFEDLSSALDDRGAADVYVVTLPVRHPAFGGRATVPLPPSFGDTQRWCWRTACPTKGPPSPAAWAQATSMSSSRSARQP